MTGPSWRDQTNHHGGLSPRATVTVAAMTLHPYGEPLRMPDGFRGSKQHASRSIVVVEEALVERLSVRERERIAELLEQRLAFLLHIVVSSRHARAINAVRANPREACAQSRTTRGQRGPLDTDGRNTATTSSMISRYA